MAHVAVRMLLGPASADRRLSANLIAVHAGASLGAASERCLVKKALRDVTGPD